MSSGMYLVRFMRTISVKTKRGVTVVAEDPHLTLRPPCVTKFEQMTNWAVTLAKRITTAMDVIEREELIARLATALARAAVRLYAGRPEPTQPAATILAITIRVELPPAVDTSAVLDGVLRQRLLAKLFARLAFGRAAVSFVGATTVEFAEWFVGLADGTSLRHAYIIPQEVDSVCHQACI